MDEGSSVTADNSTAYTGDTPLWTSTIQQGQKITVTGTATSSGANVYGTLRLPIFGRENAASLNFRADNCVNGVGLRGHLVSSGTAADDCRFQLSTSPKMWQGFDAC